MPASSRTPAGVARRRTNLVAMTIHEASRTLLKSPPELWAECSDATSLRRHLDRFGEIRITRLEPETAVAWEGENVSGTVKLEPSGWGTRVILTAEEAEIPKLGPPVVAATPPPPPVLEPKPTPSPPVIAEAQVEARLGFWARLRRKWRGFDDLLFEPAAPVVPPPASEPPPPPDPVIVRQPPPS